MHQTVRRAATATAAAVLLTALPAVAAVNLTVLGQQASGVDTRQLSVTDGAGTYGASGSRTPALLEARATADTATSFLARQNAKAVVASTYTVAGLVANAPVTFTWAFTGSTSWSTENASLGLELATQIFSRGPVAYIDGVRWAPSFVDGPVAMGDFAGSVSALIGSSGSAGPSGWFSANLPAAPWNGQGAVLATTTWLLSDGGWGDLTLTASVSVGGDVVSNHAIALVGLSVPNVGWLLGGGPATLTLDNGTVLAISAVPEPVTAMLWLSGLALLGARARRHAEA